MVFRLEMERKVQLVKGVGKSDLFNFDLDRHRVDQRVIDG